MKSLFDQTQLAGLQLKNRFIRSATYDGLAGQNGHMTNELFKVYENLAKGGVGAIITGLTSVSDLEEIYPGQMGMYEDSFIEEYRKLTEMSHSYGTKIFLQIAYLGSQTAPSSSGKRMWGASEVEDLFYKNTPQEMTTQDILSMEEAFGKAACRAKEAGFDGIQIHLAHGYLLSKFLTPYYNRRNDSYGGDIKNRARIVIETYQSIRKQVGDAYPILVKINCQDFMEQGMSFTDCKYVCHQLDQFGINAVEISGGVPSSKVDEGIFRTIKKAEQASYFKSYAAEIAELIQAPVIVVGGNRYFDELTDIVNQTTIEYISLARPLIREFDLIKRWQNREMSPAKCISCNKCFRPGGTRCIFNKL